MKRLLFLLFILAPVLTFAQRTITIDTLQGAETINFDAMKNAKFVTVTCTQTGGTSDGTLTLYGSSDGTVWTFLNGVGGDLLVASPKASITGTDLNQITITNGLVASWYIKPDTYPYHRLTAVGTSGDSTKLAINWGKQ